MLFLDMRLNYNAAKLRILVHLQTEICANSA